MTTHFDPFVRSKTVFQFWNKYDKCWNKGTFGTAFGTKLSLLFVSTYAILFQLFQKNLNIIKYIFIVHSIYRVRYGRKYQNSFGTMRY